MLAACEPDFAIEPDGAIEGVTGGNETDAARGLVRQNPPPAPFNYGPLTPENTWSALYTDYFGPPQKMADGGGQTGGRASCAAGDCHGTTTDLGATVSGFVCADKQGCYDSLTCQNNGSPCPEMLAQILITAGQPFAQDALYNTALRSAANPDGMMPYGSPPGYNTAPYTFSDQDIQRLSAWVDAGFPNN